MFRDHYAVLGIAAGASAEEVRAAYRSKVLQYHPDRHGGSPLAEQLMKELNQANDVLSSPERRARFDAERTQWLRGELDTMYRPAPGGSWPPPPSGATGPSASAPVYGAPRPAAPYGPAPQYGPGPVPPYGAAPPQYGPWSGAGGGPGAGRPVPRNGPSTAPPADWPPRRHASARGGTPAFAGQWASRQPWYWNRPPAPGPRPLTGWSAEIPRWRALAAAFGVFTGVLAAVAGLRNDPFADVSVPGTGAATVYAFTDTVWVTPACVVIVMALIATVWPIFRDGMTRRRLAVLAVMAVAIFALAVAAVTTPRLVTGDVTVVALGAGSRWMLVGATVVLVTVLSAVPWERLARRRGRAA